MSTPFLEQKSQSPAIFFSETNILPSSPQETNESYIEIHQRFAKTAYGHKLKDGKVRYDDWRNPNVSKPRWEHLLGSDVNNLDHLHWTYRLTRAILQMCPDATFSPEQIDDLLLAAVVHDWGEGIVGDVTYGDKTAEQLKNEGKALETIIHEMFESNPELEARAQHVAEEIVHTENTPLGKVFKTIERIGYLRTGLRAWKLVQQDDRLSLSEKSSLQVVAHNVLANQISTLLSTTTEFAGFDSLISDLLDKDKTSITEAFPLLHYRQVDLQYPEEKREKLRGKFQASRSAWQLR